MLGIHRGKPSGLLHATTTRVGSSILKTSNLQARASSPRAALSQSAGALSTSGGSRSEGSRPTATEGALNQPVLIRLGKRLRTPSRQHGR